MMPKIERIKKRHLLKKKEQRNILSKIKSELGELENLDMKEKIESGILDDGTQILIIGDRILFFEIEGRFFPTLHALLNRYVKVPTVTVDMGAVKYVVNGADIMRPGVTRIDANVRKDRLVAVIDERHSKPLAVGVSLYDANEMQSLNKGKVILTKHHINDDLWNFTRS